MFSDAMDPTMKHPSVKFVILTGETLLVCELKGM